MQIFCRHMQLLKEIFSLCSSLDKRYKLAFVEAIKKIQTPKELYYTFFVSTINPIMMCT